MATILNSGTLLFTPAGGTQTSIVSNTTATNVDITYSLSISHAASPETFTSGSAVLYTTVVRNTGSGTYYNPVVTVDMAGGGLSYVPESASAFLDDGTTLTPLSVTTSANSTGQVFTFGTATLPAGGVIFLSYNAVVMDNTAETLTSTATVTAQEGSTTGPTDTASDAVTITRTPLTIVKSAPATTEIGDELTYTFTLINTGTVAIAMDQLTDQLPDNFDFSNIALSVDGTSVTLKEGTDYTVTADGLLTLDPAADISIPVDGTAIITITGTVIA